MDAALGLLRSTPGDGGGGVPSDGSTTAGSILTTAKEEHAMGMSAEVSSPYPVDDNLELGLGLSIGVFGGRGGDGGGLWSNTAGPFWGQHARILTAKDFPNSISNPSCCSSVKNPSSSISGSKRSATDSVSPPSVVGWPPIRKGHKMPTSANQTKPPDDQPSPTVKETKTDGTHHGFRETKKVDTKGYLPVKVNMDGTLIGRKVDLNAHGSYESLAQTLEDMFCRKRSGSESSGPSKLLDGSSEFVLTYEDKDGDCMLVGDVPWQMFLSSVKKLRIMKNSESNKPGKHKHTVIASSRAKTDAI